MTCSQAPSLLRVISLLRAAALIACSGALPFALSRPANARGSGTMQASSTLLVIACNRLPSLCTFHGKVGLGGRLQGRRSMQIRLHKQATTTPKVRAAIQASDDPAWVLADRSGTAEQTVYK
jgi:hypothetical protein